MTSINASSLNMAQSQIKQLNLTAKATQTSDKTEQASSSAVTQKAKAAEQVSQQDGSTTTVSEQGDTATFSNEGLSKAEGMAPTGGAAPTTSAGKTTDESSEELSSYSEAQLKTMVNNGEISQTDYNQEIARRASEESTEDTTTQSLENDSNIVASLNTTMDNLATD